MTISKPQHRDTVGWPEVGMHANTFSWYCRVMPGSPSTARSTHTTSKFPLLFVHQYPSMHERWADSILHQLSTPWAPTLASYKYALLSDLTLIILLHPLSNPTSYNIRSTSIYIPSHLSITLSRHHGRMLLHNLRRLIYSQLWELLLLHRKSRLLASFRSLSLLSCRYIIPDLISHFNSIFSILAVKCQNSLTNSNIVQH